MNKPWYKQFWPWFLIVLPLTVVIWTLITVVIFQRHSVVLVTENYVKEGKAIQVDLSQTRQAKQLKLSAEISQHQLLTQIWLNKGKLGNYPPLTFYFAHSTLAEKDFVKTLTADAKGYYRFHNESPLVGRWFVKMFPVDAAWMLQGQVDFSQGKLVLLDNDLY